MFLSLLMSSGPAVPTPGFRTTGHARTSGVRTRSAVRPLVFGPRPGAAGDPSLLDPASVRDTGAEGTVTEMVVLLLVVAVTASAALLVGLIVSLRRIVDEDPARQVMAGPGDPVGSREASSVPAEPLDSAV